MQIHAFTNKAIKIEYTLGHESFQTLNNKIVYVKIKFHQTRWSVFYVRKSKHYIMQEMVPAINNAIPNEEFEASFRTICKKRSTTALPDSNIF